VQEHLRSIQHRAIAKTGYKLIDAVAEVDKAIAFAYEQESPPSLPRLLELKSKLHGLLIDRVEVVTMDLSGALQQAQHRVLSLVNPIGGSGVVGTQEDSGSHVETRDPSST
jgi:hypothetical protein